MAIDSSIVALFISLASFGVALTSFLYKVIADSRDKILARLDTLGEQLTQHLINYSDNHSRHDQMLNEIVRRQERQDRDSERLANRIRAVD